MEDSFKEDSFVEEKVGGDSFVEDSFVADVPEKKKDISQSSSVGGTSVSMESPSGYAPRSISQIKQENVKRLDFGKSNVLKQQMAKDLTENTNPTYRQHYIDTLAKKGYDKNAVEQFTQTIGTPEEQNAPDLTKYSDKYTTDVFKPITDWAVSFTEKTGEQIKTGADKMRKGVEEALGYTTPAGEEFLTKDEKGKVEVPKKPEVIHGALTALTGGTQLVFNAVPAFVGFNAAVDGITTAAKKNLSEENAKTVENVISAPFSLATITAKQLGINPKEGSNGAMLLELANFGLIAGLGHGGGKLFEKVKTVDDLKEITKKVAEDKATPEEKAELKATEDALPKVTLQDIKVQAEKSNTPESKEIVAKINSVLENAKPEHDQLHDELASLIQAHENLPEGEAKQVMAQKIDFKEEEIKDKQMADVNASIQEAKRNAETGVTVEDLNSRIRQAEKDKLAIPKGNKIANDITDNHINNLIKQRDAIQEQSASRVLQHTQERTGETGSERGGVEQIIEGAKAPEEGKIGQSKIEPQTEVVASFDSAKEGDIILHNGEVLTVIGRTKSRGGSDIIEVEKNRLTAEQIKAKAINDISARKEIPLKDVEKYHAGELSNLIDDYTKLENSANGKYTIDAEQWNNEVKSGIPAIQEKVIELTPEEGKIEQSKIEPQTELVFKESEPYDGKDYSKGKTSEVIAKEKGIEFASEEELSNHIANESENPLEIVSEYVRTKGETAPKDVKTQALDEANIKITGDEFNRYFDKNRRSFTLAKRFIDNKRTVPLDAKLQEISDRLGIEVTPEDFVEYLDNIDKKSGVKGSSLDVQFKTRFQELTGKELTPKKALAILESEAKKLNKDYGKFIDREYATYADAEQGYYDAIKSGEIVIEGAETPSVPERTETSAEGEPTAKVEAPKGKDIGVSEEMRAKQREELGLPELPKVEKETLHTNEYLNEEANKLVDSKEVDPIKLAESILNEGVVTDDIGIAVLNRGAVELDNKIIDLKPKIDEARGNGDAALDEKLSEEFMQSVADLNKIHKALRSELSKAGEKLRSAQTSMKQDFSAGNLYSRFEKANGDKKLPKEIIERLTEYATKIKELDIRIKNAEDLAGEQAKQIEEMLSKTTPKEKIAKIREKRNKLFDDWKKYRDGNNDVVKQSPLPIGDKDIEFIAKIALSYAEEGIVMSMDVANKLKSDVKKYMKIKLSEEDISKILNTEVDGRKPIDEITYNGLTGDIKQSKAKLERVKKALEDPEKYLEELNKRKAELKKKEDYKSQELKDIESEIRTANAKLAEDLKLEREKIKRKVNNEEGAIEFAQKSKSDKLKEGIANVMNVPRSLMASFDFSAPLRQGLVASVAHPKVASKAFREMFKQFASEKNFEDWIIKYKLSPEYELAKNSELYVADPSELHLNGREEEFMSNLAERIPLIGKGIKASERAYVGYLNKLRTDVFKNFSEELSKQGKTFESHPEEFKAIADFVNSSTGRGKLPNKTIEDAAPLLSSIFFSPRLIASRVNLLNPVYYAKMPPSVRMMALKDMAKFAAVASTILTLAKLGGAEVESDPRSTEFGKIKVGDTRYDVLGGFQQYIRMAAQQITGEKKTQKGIMSLTKPNFQGQSRGSEIMKFIRTKLSPATGMAVDFLSGKDVLGKDITFKEELYNHLLPLQLTDAIESYKLGGFGKVLATMIPSMFGVGTQTYSNAKSDEQKRKEFMKYLKED